MTEPDKRPAPVDTQEITSIRQNLQLIRSQIQSGRVEGAFLARQVDKLVDLLERLEAEHNRRHQGARFEALYNVSRLMGSSLDLSIVLDQVMDAILQLTGAERGFLMLRDDDGELEVTTARNFDQQPLSTDNLSYSNTIASQVLDTGESLLSTNATEDPRFSGQPSIINQGLRSIMATPLRARGKIIGVAYVDNRAAAGLFENEDLAALEALAGQAAIAIENARLFQATDQQLQERVEELTRLRRIDLQLNATLDTDKAMQITLEWAVRLSEARNGSLGLVEYNPLRIRAVHNYGLEPGETQPAVLHLVYPATLEVVQSSQTRIIARAGPQGPHTLIVPARRDEKVIGVVVLNRDSAFTTAQLDLVERVVARAAVAIENARLYAEIQAADLAKSEFVGIVAHDLKVPMATILGYAELTLMENELNPRQIDFQHKIRDTVRRMEVLVQDLADISRLESGHFYMDISRVPVKDVVHALKDSTYTQLSARNHTYVEDIAPDLPDLHVDYYRLLQVLTNLMSNAIKYTPNGGTITLRVRQVGDSIEFTVQDTGIGLSQENLVMLGTKFWRADDPFTRSQPGSGLGFAITRSLVNQMGGTMQIQSEEGKGSSFSFTVPIQPATI